MPPFKIKRSLIHLANLSSKVLSSDCARGRARANDAITYAQ